MKYNSLLVNPDENDAMKPMLYLIMRATTLAQICAPPPPPCQDFFNTFLSIVGHAELNPPPPLRYEIINFVDGYIICERVLFYRSMD